VVPPADLQSLFARLPNGELLAWDTKVKDVLPEWQLMDEYASDHVDVVDLLSEWG
jgi:hypothetical protein